jgi:protein-tyrosine phosphatase
VGCRARLTSTNRVGVRSRLHYVIDLHTHVLPGIDDGPATLAESVELAHQLATAGVRTVAATPHVRDDYPNDPASIGEALGTLRLALEVAAIPLEVVGGAELAFEQLDRPTEELRRFSFGVSSILLVETPYFGWPLALESRLFELRLVGFAVMLAHPERNPDVQADPERIERLVRSDVLVQVTTSSLTGQFGHRPRAVGLELIKRQLVHVVASDTHGGSNRALGSASVAHALGSEPLARWLTQDSPAALLEGRPRPPRPPSSPITGMRRLLRRP